MIILQGLLYSGQCASRKALDAGIARFHLCIGLVLIMNLLYMRISIASELLRSPLIKG